MRPAFASSSASSRPHLQGFLKTTLEARFIAASIPRPSFVLSSIVTVYVAIILKFHAAKIHIISETSDDMHDFFEICNPVAGGILDKKIRTAVVTVLICNIRAKSARLVYLMFGSSSPRCFFLSTALSITPMTSAAMPRQASMISGAV